MAAAEYNKMSTSEKKKEDWMNTKWRPTMGWMYMVVCITDFVLFPVLWSIIQVIGGGEVKMQWNPITLQGAGLFHISMGAILGIAVYGRTQEKLNGANAGGLAPVSQSVTTTFGTPNTGGFGSATAGAPAPGGFGGGGFGGASGLASAPRPAIGFGGKKAPPPQEDPEI